MVDQEQPDPCLSLLMDKSEWKVWSVIISIFGDAVLPRGGAISSGALAQLTSVLGIKSEAQRVAISRLAKDGWLTRSKVGRSSLYRLSPLGLETFGGASKRIYATQPETAPKQWRLVMCPPVRASERAQLEQTLSKASYLKLSSEIYLGGCHLEIPDLKDILIVEGDLKTIPEWVKQICGKPAVFESYANLVCQLVELKSCLAEKAELTPLLAIALRTLLIHRWRRILLRHPDLPPHFFPSGWQGETSRKMVLALYARLKPMSELWLDENVP
ncbi:PaaX family transcriptional regulator C-terminal domain-containing protein [Polycladidibacter stylochi]|uniref:PaaX family transcriptional regulator n=1 Tax=Polycladidibacter stylochi TaxID=1807766 RepID=UPI0008330B28|nr:PaaX family transcriptional regulator C-terminal domain-containing protein [Pseudovibrio stylochi]